MCELAGGKRGGVAYHPEISVSLRLSVWALCSSSKSGDELTE
jgi:hypothetical protein